LTEDDRVVLALAVILKSKPFPAIPVYILADSEIRSTVYGLFRDGTELRGVYYAKPEVARAACDSLEDRCDYPILLGNTFLLVHHIID